ncbi:pseudouridine synthase [Halobacteriovorax sp. ZH4_bin.1]|uniref:pseudouridine synthase n=1 Tax=unclassified Halobacteriovorax TaxID=2639665 RepID=UPI0037207B76
MSKLVRLQKFIADCGITSRRKAEDLIVQGRVKVNGIAIRELGTKVDPSIDAVEVDGKAADLGSVEKIYMIMNKPRGVMTTVNDPEGRETVIDLCKEISERIYPVGRLDYLSEGLLLMTNDGDFANLVIHPSSEITKVYEVKVFGAINEFLLKKLRAGVYIDGVMTKPQAVRVIKQLETKTWLEFRINEGKNREIRRMCEGAGLTVDKLKRVAIGGLTVEGIAPGSYRLVNRKNLLNAIGIDMAGNKTKDAVEYISSKKSVNLKKKGHQGCTAADDKAFTKFRRETYFKSIKEIAETKKAKEKEIRRQAYEEKEAAFKKRQNKKKARLAKKENQQKHTHVEFVK